MSDDIRKLANRIDRATAGPLSFYDREGDRGEIWRRFEALRAYPGVRDAGDEAKRSWIADRIAEFVAARDAELARLRTIVAAASDPRIRMALCHHTDDAGNPHPDPETAADEAAASAAIDRLFAALDGAT